MDYHQVGAISGKGSASDRFTKSLRGLGVDGEGLLYAVGDREVKVFNPEGVLQRRWLTQQAGHSVAVDRKGVVYVGELGQVERFDAEGVRLETWRHEDRLGRVTAIDFLNDEVFIADASHRCIHRLNDQGEFLGRIGEDNRRRGFVTPNGHLDFCVDADGLIRATNPGKHRVEQYRPTGERVARFGKFGGRNPADFRGCCNPTNVTVTSGGRIVVTEKADPRVKIYEPDGTFISVIASEGFHANCKNMDVVADAEGRIYVADTVTLQILVFAPAAGGAAAVVEQLVRGANL